MCREGDRGQRHCSEECQRARRRERLAATLLALSLAACGGEPEVDPWELHRALQLARTIELAAPEGPVTEAAARAAARIGRSGLYEVELTAPTAGGRGDRPRILVGGPDTPGMRALLDQLGLRAGADRFETAGGAPPFDAFVATLADPARAGLPITVACALEEGAVAPWVERVSPAWRPSLCAWREGASVLEVDLSVDGSALPGTERRFERSPDGEHTFELEGLLVHGPPERLPSMRAYLSSLERARRSVGELLGSISAELPVTRVRVVGHPEDLARASGSWDLWQINPVTGEVTTYAGPGLDDGGFGLARSLAVRAAGPPAALWLRDGVAARAALSWWGKSMPTWIARLVDGDLVPPLEQLLADEPVHSPHIVVPLRGALVSHLEQSRGAEAVATLWAGTDQLAIDDELRRAFARRLEELRDRHASRLLGERGAGLQRTQRAFRWGVNLVEPERDGSLRGYGTRACELSLERAAALGVDAVALLSTGFVESGLPRSPLGPLDDPLARAVPDLALVATMRAAEARGMSVMVRQFLLQTRSGTWAGMHAGESEEALISFFDDYRRFLVHTALVAELGGAELLCLGTELPLTTRIDEQQDAWIPDYVNLNHERWRGLIRAARGAFAGGLTYAADWSGEVDQVGFWSELDFVGTELLSSLSVRPYEDLRPDDRQASQRLRGLLGRLTLLAGEHGRPGLVVEIGFPPTTKAWLRPTDSRGDFDLDEQARLYRALHDALDHLGTSRELLGGMYLWAWSTDPDAGREQDKSWTPQNRPAQEVLAEMFGG